MNKTILYMPLLNEGTEVYRPVLASVLGDNIYQIESSIEGFSPEQLDEEWLFPSGSIVNCEVVKEKDGMYLRVKQLVTPLNE